MAKAGPLPSVELLREYFDYNSETGIFRAAKARNKTPVGRVLGYTNDKGYVYLGLFGKVYLAQRIAWKIMTGEDSAGDIDHRDGNKSNNAWLNLRLATRTQNNANSKPRNRPYPKGVKPTRHGAYRAQIQKNKVGYYLGTFPTVEEASMAYKAAANAMFGEFAKH